jgi:hypothetical protein
MTRTRRLTKSLTLALATAAVAAPTASAKSLQPPLPPDARTAPAAQSTSEPRDVSAISAAGGIAVLLVGSALYPLSRGRRVPALR